MALDTSAVDADALAVAGYVCGDEPVPTLGARGLVTGFGCKSGDYRGLRRTLRRLGSSFMHCSLAMANAILGDFIDDVERGIAEVVCVSVFDMYDETPLRLRTKDGDGVGNLPGISKVVQSELDIGVLMFCPPQAGSPDGTYVSTVLKMPCPLSVVDRGTGECLLAAIDINRHHLPNLQALVRKCKYQIDGCTADRGSANDRAEDGKYAELPSALRARFPCFAHAAHTCQGRIMNPIHFEISGCISGSAVMDNAAVLAKFRTRLSSVLRLGVQIQDAPPLRPSHPAMRHLEQLLNLCLEQSENCGDRGAILRKCLTADIETDAIVWRVRGGADRAAIKKWADDLAWALLPRVIKACHKRRWINGVYPQTQWALLGNVWHLLRRGGPAWLEGLGAKLPSKRKEGAMPDPVALLLWLSSRCLLKRKLRVTPWPIRRMQIRVKHGQISTSRTRSVPRHFLKAPPLPPDLWLARSVPKLGLSCCTWLSMSLLMAGKTMRRRSAWREVCTGAGWLKPLVSKPGCSNISMVISVRTTNLG